MVKFSVSLCAFSVILCETKTDNYTELHRGNTEVHREKIIVQTNKQQQITKSTNNQINSLSK